MRSKKVMIVEDHDDSRWAMKLMLESEGYSIFEAKNGAEAIEHAMEFLPDVIVMDLDLPRLNGVKAAARIKSIPLLAHTRIIAISAFTEYERELSSSDFLAFVRKPVNYETLLPLLAASFPKKPAPLSTN